MKNQNNYLPEDILIPRFSVDAILIGVEIGVGGGSGSLKLLKKLPNLKLYCIDPWRHVEGAEFEAALPQKKHDNIYEYVKSCLGPYKARVVILKKTSDDAVNDIPNDIDFVHIDGHHTYEQVKKDIENYFPKIRIGGLMSGHDYNNDSVFKAVHEFFKNYKVHTGDDLTWWVYKDV